MKKMNDELIKIPNGCTLVHNPKRVTEFDKIPIPRISAEQAAVVVQCIIHDDGPKNLNLLSTTGMIGERGDEYVEFTADGYQLAAFVRGGMVTNVFYCLTPKGGEYFMPHDGGSPFDDVTIDDRRALTVLLIESKMKKSGIEVVPCFALSTNGYRPEYTRVFYNRTDAECAQMAGDKEYDKTPKKENKLKKIKPVKPEKMKRMKKK